ncbi:MAG: exported protein of unknown function [Actinomycetia bacterium]|nr:exported protein of unknown function [Actinomycetes bacterium]
MTTTGHSVIAVAGETRERPRPRPAPAVLAGVVALALGLGIGRFATYHPTARATTSVAAPASSPAVPAGQDLLTTVATLEAAVARDPQNLTAWQSLGSAYIRRAAQGDPSFYDLAQKAFARADVIAPKQQATLIGEGALALSRHQFSHARSMALRVLTAQSTNPDALVVKTDADVELGNYDAAAADLQTLLTHRPALAVYARVSYLRELHGDIPGAIEAMHMARVAGAGAAIDTADVTNFLGDLEFAQGRPGAALAQYDRALAIAPQHALAAIGRGRALFALGHTDQAVQALQHLINRVPMPQAAELLGDIETTRGHASAAHDAYGLVRATTQLQRASGVVVDLELARFEADHATDEAGAQRALQLAQSAYTERPGNLYAADALEWARFRAGDIHGASGLVNRALRLGTRDAILHFHAASVLHASGDDTRARAELIAAFRQNPWFTISLRSEATNLARALTVKVPAQWAR